MGIITSKYNGRCIRCGCRLRIGDRVDYQLGRKGVMCLDCVTVTMGSAGYQQVTFKGIPFSSAIPPPPRWWASSGRSSGKSFWVHSQQMGYQQAAAQATQPKPKPSITDLALAALVACEALIVETAGKVMTAEMEKVWLQYQKVKALALQPGTGHEERSALKRALIDAVKVGF